MTCLRIKLFNVNGVNGNFIRLDRNKRPNSAMKSAGFCLSKGIEPLCPLGVPTKATVSLCWLPHIEVDLEKQNSSFLMGAT